MSFLEDIKEEDNKLYEYLQVQIVSAESHLSNVQHIFEEYTDHSILHSEKVLLNGERLNTSKLSMYEKAIFILSAYYHDIGMNVSQCEIDHYFAIIGEKPNVDYLLNRANNSNSLRNANDEIKKRFLALDHFRERHNLLSLKFIQKKFPSSETNSWINNVYLWEYVARVCEAHTFSIPELKSNINYADIQYLENGEKIDLMYISLLLRLSDICHFSRDRAYPYILKTKDFISEKSNDIWNYYSCVVNTIPDSDSNSIRIQASCDNIHQHRSIINEIKYINNELVNCHKLLAVNKSKYSFIWKFVDSTLVKPSLEANYHYIDSQFNLNKNKIISLLMGDRLYSNKLFAIRECIQNSIDSIKISSLKSNSNDYIYLYYSDTEFPTLDIYDSGTGMDLNIISNNFLSVGTKSFWKSDKGIEEWGIDTKKISLIADHGIGTLSYFMIANNIEIFTKYKKEDNYIHILIDDYKDSIIYKDTQKDEFPKFSSIDLLPTPWDLMHGTCIRFNLKEKLNFKDFIEFLSVHILRSPYPITLNYNNVEYALKDVWHIRGNIDKHLFPKDKYNYFYDDYYLKTQKEKTQAELVDDLYTEKYDFYGDHPPKDPAIETNRVNHNDINGRININCFNESNIACRISQNGILIQNAIDFISSHKSSALLLHGYGFDIDLSRNLIFQLDAERTNIVKNDYNINLLAIIENYFDNFYFEQISKIESSIYFRCGGHFYHGMTDILFEHPDSLKCFSENLCILNENHIFEDYSDKIKAFDNARIYMSGLERNKPINVSEIKQMKERILIFPKKTPLSTNGITKSSYGEKYVDLDKMKKKFAIDLNDNTIYLSDYENPFLEPLFQNFELRLKDENRYIFLIELIDGSSGQDNYVRHLIEKLHKK